MSIFTKLLFETASDSANADHEKGRYHAAKAAEHEYDADLHRKASKSGGDGHWQAYRDNSHAATCHLRASAAHKHGNSERNYHSDTATIASTMAHKSTSEAGQGAK